MGHMAEGMHAALLHKGKAAPDCTHGTCNSVNFTVLKPSDWIQGKVINIKINRVLSMTV
jgi:hypothetical protein